MPFFCIYDHPQLPLTRISVEDRRRDVTKDGFRLRYSIRVADDGRQHADDVIGRVDDLMAARTKAHGYYQAPYADVRAAYRGLLEEATPDPGLDLDGPLRGAAMVTAVLLTATMAVVLPAVTLIWLAISALQRHSGLVAMAESAVVWSIFDWRPLIHRLFHYARYGIWPR